MDNFISQEKVLYELSKAQADKRFKTNYDFAILYKNILHIPVADVRPIVRGKWGIDAPCPICGEDRYKGLDADIWACWEPPFCPNCGASMTKYNEDC